MTKWKLYDPYFNGAGRRTFSFKNDAGAQSLDVVVDENGCFSLDAPFRFPLHAFAAIVSERSLDNPAA